MNKTSPLGWIRSRLSQVVSPRKIRLPVQHSGVVRCWALLFAMFNWRSLAPAKGGQLESGEFNATGLGQTDSKVLIGGAQSAHSATDAAFAQIIVWDTPISDEGWSKLEALLQ